MKPLRTNFLAAIAAISLCLGPARVHAIPFELIVPSEVNVNGAGGLGISFTSWGWISPTAGSATDSDLNIATHAATLSDPNVAISSHSSQASAPFTLAPGEFAGFLANFSTTDNTVFFGEMGGGETLGPLWRYTIGFSFPSTSYTGGGVLEATHTIGNDVLTWSTQVNFVTTGPRFEALASQRVSSIPEPGTFSLVALGVLGLGWSRERERARHRDETALMR